MAFSYYFLNQVHALILVIETADITDGWYHRRLISQTVDITDGWYYRRLISQTVDITDSWYHRRLTSQTAIIRDTSTHTQTYMEYQNVKHDKNLFFVCLFVCHKTNNDIPPTRSLRSFCPVSLTCNKLSWNADTVLLETRRQPQASSSSRRVQVSAM